MHIGSGSHIGRVRQRNEDALLVDGDRQVFAVLDGLGGHPAGDVASRLAVAALDEQLTGEQLGTDGGQPQALGDALQAAHATLTKAIRDDPKLDGMGTTAVVLYVAPREDRAWIGHVGDSRAYLARDGDLTQVTTDHTLGGRARIAQALGSSRRIEPELHQLELRPGDRLLLCTDGLTDMVDDRDIAEIVAADDEPQTQCDELVELANAHGGRDNVTVVLVSLDR